MFGCLSRNRVRWGMSQRVAKVRMVAMSRLAPSLACEPLAGYNRRYVSDPFGNRIEVMEPLDN